MNWADIISHRRLAPEETAIPNDELADNPVIRPHQKDVDRIVFSSAFRRMQGKTQVYMFPQTDYVRNRLTHTLEVASIGRMLASGCFHALQANNMDFRRFMEEERYEMRDLTDSVAAACHAHDIGNPPFGHVGEYAIRSWFKDKFADPVGAPALASIKDAKQSDGFVYFDGNPQGFRVVSRLQGWRERGGLQLTYTTLASMLKYPYPVGVGPKADKFGYFETEKSEFEQVIEALHLRSDDGKVLRHPFVYLLEAADDIAYLTTDIEDAVKCGVVEFKDAVETLQAIAEKSTRFNRDRFESVKGGVPGLVPPNRPAKPSNDVIKYLRSAAVVAMIGKCQEEFCLNIDKILSGEYGVSSLISNNKDLKEPEKIIRETCKKKIYYSTSKVRSEAGAFNVVKSLLDQFSESFEDYIDKECKLNKMHERNANLFRVLNKGLEAEDVIDHWCNPETGYHRILDYVSGMTDRYAMQVNDWLTGRALN